MKLTYDDLVNLCGDNLPPNSCGIYIWTRVDINGFKYAYIGQAHSLINRCVEHLKGYPQHIDASISKYGLYNEAHNPYGWSLKWFLCQDTQLDEFEKREIKNYSNNGFQLRNTTIGGQGEGKDDIDGNRRDRKGYRQGVQYGIDKTRKSLNTLISKHLDIKIKDPKGCNKLQLKMLQKITDFLSGKINSL
jgi:hypothetical protein